MQPSRLAIFNPPWFIFLAAAWEGWEGGKGMEERGWCKDGYPPRPGSRTARNGPQGPGGHWPHPSPFTSVPHRAKELPLFCQCRQIPERAGNVCRGPQHAPSALFFPLHLPILLQARSPPSSGPFPGQAPQVPVLSSALRLQCRGICSPISPSGLRICLFH